MRRQAEKQQSAWQEIPQKRKRRLSSMTPASFEAPV